MRCSSFWSLVVGSDRCRYIQEGIVSLFTYGERVQALLEGKAAFLCIDVLEGVCDVFCIEGNIDLGAFHGSGYDFFGVSDFGTIGRDMYLSIGKRQTYDIVLIGTGNQGNAVNCGAEFAGIDFYLCRGFFGNDLLIVREGAFNEA